VMVEQFVTQALAVCRRGGRARAERVVAAGRRSTSPGRAGRPPTSAGGHAPPPLAGPAVARESSACGWPAPTCAGWSAWRRGR
jgi:hypothetical protein